MVRCISLAFLLASALGIATGCHDDNKAKSQKSSDSALKSGDTLWTRLGGEPAVRAIVHDFFVNGALDTRVNFKREGHPNHWDPTPANQQKLEQRLVEFISEYTGGPLKYKGRDMVTVHRGMEINETEFDALAADLGATLDKLKIPRKERDELIAVIGGTRGQIVGK